MMGKRRLKFLFFFLLIFINSISLYGNTRAKRLIRLLKESANYRVRIQSAISLGRIKDPEVVSALISALLNDPEPAVKVAVVNSLGRLGDPKALPYLEKVASDKKLDIQLREAAKKAIKQIQRIQEISKGGIVKRGSFNKPKFLIAVGEMGNATSIGKGKIELLLKKMIKDKLKNIPFVIVEDAKSGNNIGVKRRLKKEGLIGFLIQGSLIQFTKVKNIYMATVSLMVLTYPERSLKVMLQGRGGEGLKGEVPPSPEVERSLKLGAISSAIDSAIESLVNYLTSL